MAGGRGGDGFVDGWWWGWSRVVTINAGNGVATRSPSTAEDRGSSMAGGWTRAVAVDTGDGVVVRCVQWVITCGCL